MNQNRRVFVVTTEFTSALCEYDCSKNHSDEFPIQLLWCGSDSVLLKWSDGIITVVGPLGNTLSFNFYGDSLYLCQEIDGARVFTSTLCELLQKVPGTLRGVVSVG